MSVIYLWNEEKERPEKWVVKRDGIKIEELGWKEENGK